jgi:alkylglycerol monooxygenase
METYAKILLIAAPVFLVLVLAEKLYGFIKYRHEFRTMDTISSLSSGYTNVLKDVLGLSITILGYDWFYKHVAVFEIKSTFWIYVLAFIALDFAGYWIHRLSHSINFFWNRHVIHHSSEEFNLACALRQSISVFINVFSFFLIPAAILGIKPEVIAMVAPLHLFAQFWYHTIYIDRMGFLEKILVTPSHHRVHHAINSAYLDKNHSQIFIIWDKLFGTFQEELEEVKPVYGVTRPMSTWNPIKINFKHLALLIQDAWLAESWKDKFRIWFMPTGWRPEGFEEKYPVHKIDDPYNFDKYRTEFSFQGRVFVWFQFLFTLFMLIWFFAHIASFSVMGLMSYGFLIFVTVYAYTDFMDKNKSYLIFEMLKNVFGLLLLLNTDLWSPIYNNFGVVKGIYFGYFVLSAILSFVFYVREISKNETWEIAK